jgi:hypothetical protein
MKLDFLTQIYFMLVVLSKVTAEKIHGLSCGPLDTLPNEEGARETVFNRNSRQ